MLQDLVGTGPGGAGGPLALPLVGLLTLPMWVVGAAVPASPLHAQEVPLHEVSELLARSSEGFTRVVAARELSDARVVLADEAERLVRVLSPDLAAVRTVGRHGQGPGEYQTPSDVFELEGDKTAILDAHSGGFLLVHPDETIESMPRVEPAPETGRHLRMDRWGASYGQALAGAGEDSAAVARWDPRRAAFDTAAFVPVRADLPVLARERVPFTASPRWAVSSDGWIAILTPEPYRVELIDPEGRRRTGPSLSYDPVPVTEEHKEEWRERLRAPRTVVVGRRDQGGTEIQTMVWPVWEPREWPDVMPAYPRGGAFDFAPDGTLWVERATHFGDPPLFDVFDREGELVKRVRLPGGSRLVGFGEESLLVVTRDEFDLEYLVRLRFR